MRYLKEPLPASDDVGTPQGPATIAEHSALVADAETLEGHAVSARLRLNPEYSGTLENLDG